MNGDITSTAVKLSRSTPEEQGVSSRAIVTWLDEVQRRELEVHSYMLVRHGYVVSEGWWEPYQSEQPHMLFSLTKSFTSSAIGLAISEGKLTLEDKVISFFPAYTVAEGVGDYAELQIRHLLTMSDGHSQGYPGRFWRQFERNWVQEYLNIPLDYAPGTHFVYSSGCSQMLSSIIQKVTGQSLLDYLRPRLLEPLGIHAKWESSPDGISTGGWGISIRTEDMAKFGQLYLQKGLWNGARLLPEAWVEAAASMQIDTKDRNAAADWKQGYGYHFWRCRHNAYRADGAFAQFSIVMPDQDVVLAITSGLDRSGELLDTVWDILLPAMGPLPLPAAPIELDRLRETQRKLAYSAANQLLESSLADEVSAYLYTLESNIQNWRAISFDFFQEGMCRFIVRDDHGEHELICGLGYWHDSWTSLNRDLFHGQHYKGLPLRVAASATWEDDRTFVLHWRFVETTFCEKIICRFDQQGIEVESLVNVSQAGIRRLPVIHGSGNR